MSTQRYSVTPHPIETILTWAPVGISGGCAKAGVRAAKEAAPAKCKNTRRPNFEGFMGLLLPPVWRLRDSLRRGDLFD